MKKWMMPLLALACRLFLGAVFLYASWDKILHPKAFAEVVYNYQILPGPLINLTALVLPVMEFFMGLSLIFGVWLPGSVLLSNLLLAVFFGALLFNMARGLDIHCGCFSTEASPGGEVSTLFYVFRDAAFLAPALFLLVQQVRGRRPGDPARP